jgi:hypothetical protein
MTQLRHTGERNHYRSVRIILLHGDGQPQDIGRGAYRDIIYTQPDRPSKENLS